MSSSYHHGNLREALVQAAIELIELKSVGDFSLRELATKVGVSANAAYRHFKNKEAILIAVAIEGFSRMSLKMDLAVLDALMPLEAFQEIGRVYILFAQENPVLFRLMFSNFLSIQESNDLVNAKLEAFHRLKKCVALCLNSSISSHEVSQCAIYAWGLVHGLSYLVLENQLVDMAQDIDSLMDQFFNLAPMVANLLFLEKN